MNNQDVFNKVWQYFIVDNNDFGWDSLNNRCVYVGDDGVKCAIGCCLPDGIIDRKANTLGVTGLLGGYPSVSKLFSNCDRRFLSEIQADHDDSACSGDYTIFEKRLISLAKDWNLYIPKGLQTTFDPSIQHHECNSVVPGGVNNDGG